MTEGDKLNASTQFAAEQQDDFLNNIDLEKVGVVLKKSIPWIIILMIMTCSAAYLYVRYTKPLFQSQSILKLDVQSEASIIGIRNPLENPNISGLSGEIELLKSELFFNKVVETIKYDVAYYYYGQILEEERYKNSPFVVSHLVKNQSFYDKPIDLEILNEDQFRLEYELGGILQSDIYTFNQEIFTPHFNFLVEKTNAFGSSNGIGKYYFVVNSNQATINYLQRNVIVEPLNFNAKTIRISLNDFNKNKARDFVIAIDTLYLSYTKEAKNKTIEQKIAFLDAQLSDTNKKLEEYEDYFEDFTITNRTTSLENDLGEAIITLEALDTQYVKLKTEQTNLELVIEQIEAGQVLIISPFTVSSLPPALASGLAEYNKLVSERETKLASYNETTFVIQQIDKQLRSEESKLKKLFAQYRSILQETIAQVDSRRKIVESAFVQLPSMGTEFRKNRRFYNLFDETYLQLVRSKSELEIARAGTVTNFVILSPASLPNSPIEPQSLLIYGIGIIAGLILSTVFVLIRYLLHNKINSVKELERLVKAPVLGSVPFYKLNGDSETTLVIDQTPKSGLSEALRSIRTNMEFLNPNKANKIISVTSTVSGEGKTFFSVNLGAILSLSNQKVIIVDLDMRKPKVHTAFGDEKGAGGVSTILIGKEKLSKCIRQTKMENLSYLTAGPTPPNPSELLLGESFDRLLSDLKKDFNVILLDTPPVGLVTDGILVMHRADLPIYIMRADYSKRVFAQSLNNLVKMNRFSNLSVILNSVKYSKGYGYGGGYVYGGYGHGYYEEDSNSGNGSIFKKHKTADTQ